MTGGERFSERTSRGLVSNSRADDESTADTAVGVVAVACVQLRRDLTRGVASAVASFRFRAEAVVFAAVVGKI